MYDPGTNGLPTLFSCGADKTPGTPDDLSPDPARYEPGTTWTNGWVSADQRLPDEWVVRAKLQPDPQGNVEVLTPFWGDNLTALWQRSPKTKSSKCVHPLLVYADLLANGEERSLETAKRIYDHYLRDLATSA